MNDYTTCRELKPYLEPTKAMRLGAPGKFGSLDLVFELDKDKKSIMQALGQAGSAHCTARIVL